MKFHYGLLKPRAFNFSENTSTAALPFAVCVSPCDWEPEQLKRGGNCFCACGVVLSENLGIVTTNLSKLT